MSVHFQHDHCRLMRRRPICAGLLLALVFSVAACAVRQDRSAPAPAILPPDPAISPAPATPPVQQPAATPPTVTPSPAPNRTSLPSAQVTATPARPVRSSTSPAVRQPAPVPSWAGQVAGLIPGTSFEQNGPKSAWFFREVRNRRIPLFEQAIVLTAVRAELAGIRELDRPFVAMEDGRVRLLFPSDATPDVVARVLGRTLGVKGVDRVAVVLGR